MNQKFDSYFQIITLANDNLCISLRKAAEFTRAKLHRAQPGSKGQLPTSVLADIDIDDLRKTMAVLGTMLHRAYRFNVNLVFSNMLQERHVQNDITQGKLPLMFRLIFQILPPFLSGCH